MFIDENKCIGCGNCIYYCPTGAIYIEKSNNKKIAKINQDECVECGLCERLLNIKFSDKLLNREICPTQAFYNVELKYPRIIRQIFSDPTKVKKETGVFGRGTEEVKTIDVTNRIDKNEIAMNVELGRPGIGTRLSEINKMTMALAKEGVKFEPNNPLTLLMKDINTGELKEEILNEKVLSAIIEFKIKPENINKVLNTIFNTKVNTVFVVGVFSVVSTNEEIFHEKFIKNAGYEVSVNGKTNIGLGKKIKKEVLQ
jgi:ferredoxin